MSVSVSMSLPPSGSLQLLLFATCLCAVTISSAQNDLRLDFNEGEVCKEEGGVAWTCIAFRKCRSAQRLRRRSKQPIYCKADPLVCCQPEPEPKDWSASNPTPPADPTPSANPTQLDNPDKAALLSSKSRQKCQEYAKAVFTTLPDQNATINHCGANVEPLITNGMKAKPREYPHMALVGYGEKPDVEWLCGGSLISERFVLTAAHCTMNVTRRIGNEKVVISPKWVRLGEYNKNSKLDDGNGLAQPDDYMIAEKISHPGYVPNKPYDDIALYRLERDVRFNEFVRPACLHTSRTFAKTYAIATGWGYTEWGGQQSDILQKGNMTIANSTLCRDAYQSRFSIRYQVDGGIRDASQMCAGDVENGVDTCQGDSGGPLQLRLRDPYCMYGVIGVTSLGSWCGGNIPGVYTRVSHYVQWIESVVWP